MLADIVIPGEKHEWRLPPCVSSRKPDGRSVQDRGASVGDLLDIRSDGQHTLLVPSAALYEVSAATKELKGISLDDFVWFITGKANTSCGVWAEPHLGGHAPQGALATAVISQLVGVLGTSGIVVS